MDEEVTTTLNSLRSRNIKGVYAENIEEATTKLLALIPTEAIVGRDDSTTVTQIGIIDELRKRGTRVLDRSDTPDRMKRVTTCDIFLTGTNAVTRDGRLMDVDGTGTRIVGTILGHPETVIIVGRNKIVKDLDEAFYRLRHVIAPNHVRIRAAELGGRRRDTPCVSTGKCIDCRTKDRVCNIFAIIEGKPSRTGLTVMIVNEDLGLAWDESWSQERIERIVENYKTHVHVPR